VNALVNSRATETTARIAQLLNPRSVAVIGASEDWSKFGGRIYRLLLKHGYVGTIYPINPVRDELLGRRTYPSVADTPQPPDIVIMAIPQAKVHAEIEIAARRGALGGVVITAQFSEAGPEGAAAERDMVAAARAHGMRLIGPNCLGFFSPANRVVLCSSPSLDIEHLPVGCVGFISQSGALMATIWDRAKDAGVAFSHCVSVGNQADLELSDFIDFLIDDPATSVLCTYVEGIKDPAHFIAVARRAREAGKPWLVVKAGRTQAGSRAAFSHTASIAGDHAVFAAVCREEGVILLDEPGAMMTLAALLARRRSGFRGRIGIVSASGGGGALAADEVAATLGLELASFAPATRDALDLYYASGKGVNPLDLGGRQVGDAATVARASTKIVADDPNTDIVLTIIATSPDIPMYTENLSLGLKDGTKPALFVVEPGEAADGGRAVLIEHAAPFTNYIGEAMKALAAWSAHSRTVAPAPATRPSGISLKAAVVGVLDEAAAKALLVSYGVAAATVTLARSADEAATASETIGYPVVLKIVSPEVVHKTEVGGVAVGLTDAASVRAAFKSITAAVGQAVPQARIEGVAVQPLIRGEIELIVGARHDPQFGAVLVIGAGGVLVELLKDRAVLRAPASAADVRRALESLALWPVLAGYRGRPALDIGAAVDAIERIGWLAHDLGEREFELDVNPLAIGAAGSGVAALDARLRVGDKTDTMSASTA